HRPEAARHLRVICAWLSRPLGVLSLREVTLYLQFYSVRTVPRPRKGSAQWPRTRPLKFLEDSKSNTGARYASSAGGCTNAARSLRAKAIFPSGWTPTAFSPRPLA